MPVKRYGIYLLYPPATELRGQGLGRHLAAFLRASGDRADVRFAVACPSWLRRELDLLCDEEGVDLAGFDLIAPARPPLVLALREWYQARQKRPKRIGRLTRFLTRMRALKGRIADPIERWLVANRSVGLLILFAALMVPVGILGVIVQILRRIARVLRRAVIRATAFLAEQTRLEFLSARLQQLIVHPLHDAHGARLFRLMEEAEIGLLHALIRDRNDISAWYCPTPFWPDFNQLAAPRLMCVPDVVLLDFPVGFTALGGSYVFDDFREIEKAVAGGDHFVTYSERAKWHTLVDHYNLDPDLVHVIRHGASRLDEAITVTGWTDNAAATDMLCRNLFRQALSKAKGNRFASFFGSGDVQFLFYASQFRPNKNVITLLRAFDHLQKRRFRGHKLVLTGLPDGIPEIAAFIRDHNLENDVLCLNGLTVRELAACYRLADLAINPTLSEGGFPFTFTEALSVGTPVVMGRIPVTDEVIGDAEFYADMSFDPYDWRDLAERIEWALDHREALYVRQRAFFDTVLAPRGWGEMVDDYVAVLDRIAGQKSNPRSRLTASA